MSERKLKPAFQSNLDIKFAPSSVDREKFYLSNSFHNKHQHSPKQSSLEPRASTDMCFNYGSVDHANLKKPSVFNNLTFTCNKKYLPEVLS